MVILVVIFVILYSFYYFYSFRVCFVNFSSFSVKFKKPYVEKVIEISASSAIDCLDKNARSSAEI